MHTSPLRDSSEPSVFYCDVSPRDDVTFVTVVGELDRTTADVFAEALEYAMTTYGLPIVLECSHLTYVDSSGLRPLLDYRHRLPIITLAGVDRVARTVLETLNLQMVFPTYARLDAVPPDHPSPPRFPSRSAYASRPKPTMHFRAHGRSQTRTHSSHRAA
jgi:anti-sigma B factor antagonist